MRGLIFEAAVGLRFCWRRMGFGLDGIAVMHAVPAIIAGWAAHCPPESARQRTRASCSRRDFRGSARISGLAPPDCAILQAACLTVKNG